MAGIVAFAGTDRDPEACCEDNALVRAGAGDARGGAGCWWWTARARSAPRWWVASWPRWRPRTTGAGIVVHGAVRDAAELAAAATGIKALALFAPKERQGGHGGAGCAGDASPA